MKNQKKRINNKITSLFIFTVIALFIFSTYGSSIKLIFAQSPDPIVIINEGVTVYRKINPRDLAEIADGNAISSLAGREYHHSSGSTLKPKSQGNLQRLLSGLSDIEMNQLLGAHRANSYNHFFTAFPGLDKRSPFVSTGTNVDDVMNFDLYLDRKQGSIILEIDGKGGIKMPSPKGGIDEVVFGGQIPRENMRRVHVIDGEGNIVKTFDSVDDFNEVFPAKPKGKKIKVSDYLEALNKLEGAGKNNLRDLNVINVRQIADAAKESSRVTKAMDLLKVKIPKTPKLGTVFILIDAADAIIYAYDFDGSLSAKVVVGTNKMTDISWIEDVVIGWNYYFVGTFDPDARADPRPGGAFDFMNKVHDVFEDSLKHKDMRGRLKKLAIDYTDLKAKIQAYDDGKMIFTHQGYPLQKENPKWNHEKYGKDTLSDHLEIFDLDLEIIAYKLIREHNRLQKIKSRVGTGEKLLHQAPKVPAS